MEKRGGGGCARETGDRDIGRVFSSPIYWECSFFNRPCHQFCVSTPAFYGAITDSGINISVLYGVRPYKVLRFGFYYGNYLFGCLDVI